MKLLILLFVAAFAEFNKCKENLLKVLKASPNQFAMKSQRDDFANMNHYSGKAVNDLGHFDDCRDMEHAKYMLIQPAPIVYFALCVPIECKEEDVRDVVEDLVYRGTHTLPVSFIKSHIAAEHMNNIIIRFPEEEIDAKYKTMSDGAKATGIIFLIIIFTQAGITFYHIVYLKTRDDPNEIDEEMPRWLKTMINFSFLTNWYQLFDTKGQDFLRILNAAKFMSICWILLAHNGYVHATGSTIFNLESIADNFDNYDVMAISYGGFFGFDTLFLLSGIIVGYTFLEGMFSQHKISVGQYILTRILTILAPYIFIMFLTWGLVGYLADGPNWHTIDTMYDDCKDFWWANLMFINNFIPNLELSDCLSWTWYIALEVQFFLISIPFLYFYAKFSRLVGWLSMFTFIAINLCLATYIAYYNDLNAAIVAAKDNSPDFNYYYHSKPYCRIAPYAIGIMIAFIIFTYRRHNETGEIFDPFAHKIGQGICSYKVAEIFCYLAGIALIDVIIFGEMDAYQDAEDMWKQWSRKGNAFFLGFSHCTFALGVGSIFLPLLLDRGTYARSFLGNALWIPLGKMTLIFYLLHYVILKVIVHYDRMAFHFSVVNIYRDALMMMLLTVLFSIPIFLLTEGPVRGLIKQYDPDRKVI